MNGELPLTTALGLMILIAVSFFGVGRLAQLIASYL